MSISAIDVRDLIGHPGAARDEAVDGTLEDLTSELAWIPEHIHLVRESGTERATADHEAIGRVRQEAAA